MYLPTYFTWWSTGCLLVNKKKDHDALCTVTIICCHLVTKAHNSKWGWLPTYNMLHILLTFWPLGWQKIISERNKTVWRRASVKRDKVCPHNLDEGMWILKNVELSIVWFTFFFIVQLADDTHYFSATRLLLFFASLYYRTFLLEMRLRWPIPTFPPEHYKQITRVKERFSVLAKERSVSCGRISFCPGRTISCRY